MILKKGFVLFVLLMPVSVIHAAVAVFACEPEWAALATELGGDDVKVFSATTAQQDVHHIQARPALIARLRRAQLLVCTGAGLESGWLPLLLRRARNSQVMPGQAGYLEAAKQVRLREVPVLLDRSQGDIHAQGNPHLQLDPRNITRVARALSRRLQRIDPAHAGVYRQRQADFEKRWLAAIARWEEQGAPLRGQRIVVHHRQWPYLFAWLGMEQAGELEPKPGIPPTPGHLAELKARLSEQPARMVIRAPYVDPKPSQWLARQTGMPAVLLPYTVGGTPEAGDLFGLFDDTLARLLGVLQ